MIDLSVARVGEAIRQGGASCECATGPTFYADALCLDQSFDGGCLRSLFTPAFLQGLRGLTSINT